GGMRLQRTEFGAEQQARALPADVERLLAEAIAGEREFPGAAVPCGEREHAGRALERGGHAPARDRLHQGLGIGAAAPCDAGQPRAQLEMVVDLAIEGDDMATVA